MNGINSSHSLTEQAEVLTFAIRRHAETLARSTNPPEIIAAANSVRAAARDYVQSVLAATGWGNVFADLDSDGDMEESSQGEECRGSDGGEPPVVIYRHEYEFRVHDFDRALQLLESRTELQDAAFCKDYEQSYTGLVAGLAEVDGWRPSIYDQTVIEVLSDKWESILAEP
jgi:hypothetical protein